MWRAIDRLFPSVDWVHFVLTHPSFIKFHSPPLPQLELSMNFGGF